MAPQFNWLLHVSGLGEVWTHSTDAVKFGQFGWRCTNKESSYSDNTLVGNWNEKRFDVKEQRKAKPLPSDVSTHAYMHANTHTHTHTHTQHNTYTHTCQWRIYIVNFWTRSSFCHFHAVFRKLWLNNRGWRRTSGKL